MKPLCASLIVLVAPVFAGVLCADDTSVRRIEIPAEARTSAGFRQALLNFCLNELRLYEQRTADRPNVKDAAKAFLRRSIVELRLPDDRSARNGPTLSQLAAKAIDEARSKDPFVRGHYAHWLWRHGRQKEAEAAYSSAKSAFDRSSYPPGMRWLVLLHMKRVMSTSERVQQPIRALEMLYDVAPDWFAYARTLPNSQRAAWRLYTEGIDGYLPRAKKSLDACGQASEKDPWIWEMLQAQYELDFSRHERGAGPAYRVNRDKWLSYLQHARLASQHFRQAHSLRPDFPEAATAMITMASRGLDLEIAWSWFQRAVAAEADYMPAYQALLESLRPENGGSVDEMLAFGDRCAHTGRYDTNVPYMCVVAALAAQEASLAENLLDRSRHYEKLEYVLLRLADHPFHDRTGNLCPTRRRLLLRNLAFAIDAGRMTAASRLWARLGGPEISPQHTVFGIDLETRRVLNAGSREQPHPVVIDPFANEFRRVANGILMSEELLENLGDDNFCVRDRATRRLIELPIQPTARLKGLAAGTDLEKRFRAAASSINQPPIRANSSRCCNGSASGRYSA